MCGTVKLITFVVLSIVCPVWSVENPMCDVKPSSIVVEYSFQYSDMQNCPPSAMSNPLDPISVTIPANGTAQNVLEASVDVSREYQFTATYFGSTLGYFIDTINGTSSNNPCFWFFYFQAPGQPGPVLSNLSVSNFIIPTSGYSIFMQYEKFKAEHDSSPPANDTEETLICDVKTVAVEYAFQYTDEQNCPPSMENNPLDPITVTIPANGTALNVLEASVNVDRAYRFTATYFGATLGYIIDAINGTSSNMSCFWFFYIQTPGSPNPVPSNLGVSNFEIPTSGYSVFMRYEQSNEVDNTEAIIQYLSAFPAAYRNFP